MNVEAYAQRKNKKAENFCTRFSQSPFNVPNSLKNEQGDSARNPERASDNSIWIIAVVHQLRPFNDDLTVHNVAYFLWLQYM